VTRQQAPATGPQSAPDFTAVLLPPHRAYPSLLLSLGLHLIAVAALPAAAHYIGLWEERLRGAQVEVAEVLPLRPSRVLYYQPQSPPAAGSGRTPQRTGSGKAGAAQPGALRISPRVQLPELPAPPKMKSVILQPIPETAAAISQTLPPIASWTPPEKPTPKSLVLPARKAPQPQEAVLDAPPSPNLPNQELRLADLSQTGIPASQPPALPRPAASASPLRVFQLPGRKEEPRAGRAADSRDGETAVLITAAPTQPALGTVVSVPPVIGRPPLDLPGEPAPPHAAERKEGASQGSGGAGASQGPGAGTGSHGNTDGREVSGGGPTNPLLVPSAPPPERPLPAVRITRPKEGRYSFLVLGSAPEESFPETGGMMRCKMVYTVYLRIGVRPDWTLLFCPPAQSAAAAGKLEAPYPFVMLRPELAFGAEDRLFVHGSILETGRFSALTFPGSISDQDRDLLLRSLNLWEFRPASRGGQPVGVEILLIIPRPEP
jgi:hypothetical protein